MYIFITAFSHNCLCMFKCSTVYDAFYLVKLSSHLWGKTLKLHFWEFHFPSQYQVWYISSSQSSMLWLMRAYCTPYVLSEICLSYAWYFLHMTEFRLAICKWLMFSKGFSTPTSVDLAAFLLDQ